MSTRKLILTALVCGLAIVLAGGVKLFQIATEDKKVNLLGLSEESTLGDMTVSVLSVTPGTDRTVVTVSMAGVDSADAVAGWRMLSGGDVSSPVPGPWNGVQVPACTTTTIAGVTCSIVFPASAGTVTVAYLRGGAQSQWSEGA
jgi:hypothetical protein